MSSQVSLNTKTVASTPEDTTSNQKLSVKDICNKVTSINASQIALIGNEIGGNLLDNLGPSNKNRIELQVMQKNESQRNFIMHLELMLAMDDSPIAEKEFLSNDDCKRFLLSILKPLTDALEDSFAKPNDFLEFGTIVQISDDLPMGILKETANNLKIDITENDVPSKYYIYLKLDRESMQQEAELVFALTAECNGIKFSEETFTIQDLEETLVL